MIQHSEEYDNQNQKLGIGTYYIENNDQSMGGYGGIKELILSKNSIQIYLDDKGYKNVKKSNFYI